MPRRMLDGDVRKSASLSRVSLEAGYSFVLLMTIADDQGRADGDVLTLRSELFPRRRDITDKDVERWISELVDEGCIHRYEFEGEEYIHFPAWTDYQRLRTQSKERRPAPEKCCLEPALAAKRSGSEKREARGKSGEQPHSAATRRTSPPIKRGKGRRASSTQKSSRPTTAPEALSEDEMARLTKWAQSGGKYSDEQIIACADHLNFFIDEALGWNRSKGKKYVDWVSVVENWIRNGITQEWIKNGRPTKRYQQDQVDGKGPLQRIFEEHVGMARPGGR